ncbi:hypothetical protein OIU79_000955 [Salix purpurea]|uniref:Uncharacterized protein n=1 Tax=Salix purpurea TaxID=77065 RepID=A0A9Q0ZNK0_SALPP|nr:hypothetical protein OIU79_000955 [Salix purpurea]
MNLPSSKTHQMTAPLACQVLAVSLQNPNQHSRMEMEVSCNLRIRAGHPGAKKEGSSHEIASMLSQMLDSLQHHCSTKQRVHLQAFLEGVQRGSRILVDQTSAQPVLQSPDQLNFHPQLSL